MRFRNLQEKLENYITLFSTSHVFFSERISKSYVFFWSDFKILSIIIDNPTTVFTFFFKGSGELSTLHQFTCPSSGCVWTVLEQQLQVPRAKHVAFLIDNSAFNCKQQGNSTELIFWNKSVLTAKTLVEKGQFKKDLPHYRKWFTKRICIGKTW